MAGRRGQPKDRRPWWVKNRERTFMSDMGHLARALKPLGRHARHGLQDMLGVKEVRRAKDP